MKEEMIYILDSNCMGYFLRGKENNQRSENEFVDELVKENKTILITAVTLYEGLKYGGIEKNDKEIFEIFNNLVRNQKLYIGDDYGKICLYNIEKVRKKEISLKEFEKSCCERLLEEKRKFLKTLFYLIEYLIFAMRNIEEDNVKFKDALTYINNFNEKNNFEETYNAQNIKKINNFLKRTVKELFSSLGFNKGVHEFANQLDIKEKMKDIIDQSIHFFNNCTKNNFDNNHAILYGYCAYLYFLNDKKFKENDFVDTYLMTLIGPNVRVITHDTLCLDFMSDCNYYSKDIEQNFDLCQTFKIMENAPF